MVSRQAFRGIGRYIMVTRLSLLVAFLLPLLSCTDLTEYDDTFKAGVSAFSLEDLSTVVSIGGIAGARSLCATSNYLLVATTKGYLESYNPYNLEHIGSYPVGSPSPSGYFFMDYSGYENSVYLIGAFGQIIEMNASTLDISDIFSVCESPVYIEFMENDPYLYVADVSSSMILELRAETNGITRDRTLPSSPVCMAMDHTQDTMLVGTTGIPELVTVGSSGSIYRRTMTKFPGILAIEAVPGDTTLCAVFDAASTILGVVMRYFPPYGGGTLWNSIGSLPGEAHYLAVDELGYMTFVLSYNGNGSSILSGYCLDDHSLIGQVEIPGYPVDLDCGDNMVYALTIE